MKLHADQEVLDAIKKTQDDAHQRGIVEGLRMAAEMLQKKRDSILIGNYSIREVVEDIESAADKLEKDHIPDAVKMVAEGK